jgi:hypothetical protein
MCARSNLAATTTQSPHRRPLPPAAAAACRLNRKRVGKAKNDDWLSFFDVVLVGCGKPGFFNERRPLFAVNTRDGSLVNTDNGAPTLPIDDTDLPADQVWLDLHVANS